MPLCLQRLKEADNLEWLKAKRELHLWDAAKSTVAAVIGAGFPQDVDDVADTAVIELVNKAIHRCRNVEMILPLLRRIAKQRAIDFRRSAWAKCVALNQKRVDAQVDERETILRQRQERFGDRLRLDGSPESVVEVLPKRAGLNLIESAVLRDLIWRKMTHQEFADEYGIPLGSVGRIRAETLRKIRVFFHQNGAL